MITMIESLSKSDLMYVSGSIGSLGDLEVCLKVDLVITLGWSSG